MYDGQERRTQRHDDEDGQLQDCAAVEAAVLVERATDERAAAVSQRAREGLQTQASLLGGRIG